MRLTIPNITFTPESSQSYAKRLDSLTNARIGLIDGWGVTRPDGTKGVYPTMAAIANILERDHGATVTTWYLKDNFSARVTDAELRALCAEADLVINGEGH
jgi:hypothetical protein